MSSMNAGGAESFLMKQYRKLDREKYQMDFCVNINERGYYDDEIEALGGKIYRIPPKSKDFRASFKGLENIVRENGYKCVMCSSVKPGTVLELIAAKKGGAERLIYRSSSAGTDGGFKRKLLHSTVGQLAKVVPDVKIAPSKEAAEYCFGKGCVEKGKVDILYNGVDTEQFYYADYRRSVMRAQLGLGNELAVFHVGRFTLAKNHGFLLEVFAEILKLQPDAKLYLVGGGELEENVKRKVNKLDIIDSVVFLGIRKDIPDLLCAADIFVFPSFYEGMPNTVIEAQALSLPCVISDRITSDADITGRVKYLPLGDAKLWAKTSLEYAEKFERHDMTGIFKEKKYDSDSTAREFVRYCFGE